jgi:hypothetical protein
VASESLSPSKHPKARLDSENLFQILLIIGPLVLQEDLSENVLQNNSLFVLNVKLKSSSEPERAILPQNQ